ncbi:hypothetical protein [Yinghuangia seranimata]|uniref:hypothetical protein n=1 Tax=Yinghuangia seranimata TaxID=408067 RepID=UPI00248CF142|nr:hypothetical protein [Yinghuangia seranimata]MDI2130964.1 hypothetical protein [Yinghuangia seranimata]
MASALRGTVAAALGAAVALGIAAPAAHAAENPPQERSELDMALDTAAPSATRHLGDAKLNPMAGTGADSLPMSDVLAPVAGTLAD